ncbi:MAG TPA: metalloregulator ArsR/SmtB family transcription factor [Planctomycetota bacterium]|nr:metalloregulator ArsR/SmtB family transcription factor [Planctomycetota bacterium]
MSDTFRALADPTRREILRILRRGEITAGEIGSNFPVSAPTISRHLSVLESAGLVAERREGVRIYYRLVPRKIALALESFLSAVCPTQRRMRKEKP